MSDRGKDALRVDFDGPLKLEFHGSKVTSDAGLLAYRELEDANDAERLSVDPAMRHVVGGRAKDRHAASTSQMGRFETEVLIQSKNLAALADLSGMWIDSVRERKPVHEVILDMDSSVSETYGEQEGSAYNGHFGCTCYHPLFCFNQFGDLERAMLRNGNTDSSAKTTTRSVKMTAPLSGIKGEASEQRRRSIGIGLNGRFRACRTQIRRPLAVWRRVWGTGNWLVKAPPSGVRSRKLVTAVVRRKPSGNIGCQFELGLTKRLLLQKTATFHRRGDALAGFQYGSLPANPSPSNVPSCCGRFLMRPNAKYDTIYQVGNARINKERKET